MSSGSDRVPGSSPANSPADGAAEVIARSARRGVLYISLAKVWFLLAGLVLPLVLPRVFATATFGMWTLVSGWFSPLNNVIVTATIQAVSKFAASGSIEAAKTAALRMNVLVAEWLGVSFWWRLPSRTSSTIPS
jgi:hypothetical protein